MMLFSGTVTAKTKITAIPKPKAVFTFLDKAKNVHAQEEGQRHVFNKHGFDE